MLRQYSVFLIFLLLSISGLAKGIKLDLQEPYGLAYNHGDLFVTDLLNPGLYIPPKRRLIELSGRPTAVTVHNKQIWIADASGSKIRVFDKNGKQVKVLSAPFMITGLAFCNGSLYAALHFSGRVVRLDPSDGTVISTFKAPRTKPTALACWQNRYLIVADRDHRYIYIQDPINGFVLWREPTSIPYISGIAVKNNKMYLLDRTHRRIVVKDVYNPAHRIVKTDPRKVRVQFIVRITNTGTKPADVTAYVALPSDYVNQQVLNLKLLSTPIKTIDGEGPGKIVEFYKKSLEPGRVWKVGYTVKAILYHTYWRVLPGSKSTYNINNLQNFLKDADKYQIHSQIIQQITKECCSYINDPVEKIRAILSTITNRLHYELSGGWNPAPMVLMRGSGSCSEYTFSLISLARASNLPSRYVGSIVFRGTGSGYDDVFHRWAEVYLPGYGWVPVDANKADSDSPAEAATGFGELGNNVLITSWSAGPSPQLDWDYDYNVKWTCRGSCDISVDPVAFFHDLSQDRKK